MVRDYIQRNAASRERLRSSLERLADADMARDVDGWTVGVTLLHLAFWDRFTLRRWQAVVASGASLPPSLGQPFTDLVNDAAIDTWVGVDAAMVRRVVMSAAEDGDAYVAGLPDVLVAAALAGGMDRALDRSVHRATHLDTLARALGPDR